MRNGLEIEWSARAVKDMRRLASRDREVVLAKIEQYAAEPASLANQVIALTGIGYLRMRVGDHRVIFRVEHGSAEIMFILRVMHRRDAYG